MTICIVANPRAGSGKAREAAQVLEARLPHADLAWTREPGDGKRLAQNATALGATTICVVGGDGTIGECVTGILETRCPPPRPRLLIVPAGTGGDYRRSFGMDESVDQAVERYCLGRTRKVDVGSYFLGATADANPRYFINVLSFGIGGLTDRIVANSSKWMGGRAAFFLGGVRATLAYEPVPLQLEVDGVELPVRSFRNVAVCLGRYFGGGMQVAPNADPSDGLFDVVMMSGSRLGTLTLAKDIYAGTHLRREGVEFVRARKLRVRATRAAEVLVDADGEQPGALPLEIEILPSALELFC